MLHQYSTTCIRCDYSLIGLGGSALCPECNLPVAQTRLGNSLHLRSPGALRTSEAGLTLIVLGCACYILGPIAFVWHPQISAVLGACGAYLGCAGAWTLASHSPDTPLRPKERSRMGRMQVLAATAAVFLTGLLLFIMLDWYEPSIATALFGGFLDEVAPLFPLGTMLLSVCLLIHIFWCCRDLSLKLSEESVSAELRRAAFMVPLFAFLSVAVPIFFLTFRMEYIAGAAAISLLTAAFSSVALPLVLLLRQVRTFRLLPPDAPSLTFNRCQGCSLVLAPQTEVPDCPQCSTPYNVKLQSHSPAALIRYVSSVTRGLGAWIGAAISGTITLLFITAESATLSSRPSAATALLVSAVGTTVLFLWGLLDVTHRGDGYDKLPKRKRTVVLGIILLIVTILLSIVANITSQFSTHPGSMIASIVRLMFFPLGVLTLHLALGTLVSYLRGVLTVTGDHARRLSPSLSEPRTDSPALSDVSNQSQRLAQLLPRLALLISATSALAVAIVLVPDVLTLIQLPTAGGAGADSATFSESPDFSLRTNIFSIASIVSIIALWIFAFVLVRVYNTLTSTRTSLRRHGTVPSPVENAV